MIHSFNVGDENIRLEQENQLMGAKMESFRKVSQVPSHFGDFYHDCTLSGVYHEVQRFKALFG